VATSGIGGVCSRRLAARGHYLVARNSQLKLALVAAPAFMIEEAKARQIMDG
jgi:NAD(P)-dependent dehydrogenase (short-subunit alcohol dehydrogenase family)